MRAQSDEYYSNFLLRVGNGLDCGQGGIDGAGIILPNAIVTTRDIIDETFGSNPAEYTAEIMARKFILSPKNDDILELNERILNRLSTRERIYLSSDRADSDENDNSIYPTEYLNSITPGGMPLHKLRLKIGCIVVLLRNLNSAKGLCNGTRLKVLEFKDHTILCSPLHQPNTRVLLPRIDLTPADSAVPFKLRRRQFPVRLAYAMTINKSQGQTFDKVGIYLPNPVFAHGQLYVALSRVRRQADVKVFIRSTTGQGPHPRFPNLIITRNIVYKEALS